MKTVKLVWCLMVFPKAASDELTSYHLLLLHSFWLFQKLRTMCLKMNLLTDALPPSSFFLSFLFVILMFFTATAVLTFLFLLVQGFLQKNVLITVIDSVVCVIVICRACLSHSQNGIIKCGNSQIGQQVALWRWFQIVWPTPPKTNYKLTKKKKKRKNWNYKQNTKQTLQNTGEHTAWAYDITKSGGRLRT